MSIPPEAESMPVPPSELISRVAAGPNVAPFLWSGRQSVRELRRTLAIVDRELESFEAVLDFGCGCGRMLLWLEHLGTERKLYGADVDAEAIAWCRENIPYATVSINHPDPPLPYPDGTFDLIINHSVFTHIDEGRQDMWLTELQRVARPGGFLVLSTHGEIAIPDDAVGLRYRLERDGIAFLDDARPAGSRLPAWYQTTYHAPWYVFEHWGGWFTLRGYVPGGDLGYQDHVLLERRADDLPSPTPLVARPSLGTGERVSVALRAARGYRGEHAAAPRRFRWLRKLSRTVVLRTLRPYSAHEDHFDEAVAVSIAELAQAKEDHAAQLEALTERITEGLAGPSKSPYADTDLETS